ncbi:serine protease 3 [Drosophila pseudoobscura]|uniref:Serine protease 3 n=1 Tax=Drosophila pseudoobscura pseudoobscura TaxID=46245 RepID=Q2M0U4_DROPS|nr:serine protease 3 [Drosophila pseudoobscura]
MKILSLILLTVALAGSCAAVPLPAGLESRITNGDLAVVGQFPYQAGLNISFGNTSTWCGGTLISHRWIVTAAHCTDGAESVTVYLGAINIQDENEPGQRRFEVAKSGMIVHTNWTASTVANDISLIRLPILVRFTDSIRSAGLPRRVNGSYPTYEYQKAYASGWGRDSDSSDVVSPTLRFVKMPILPHTLCKMYWSGAVSENMICMSTTSGKSTCQGDSGGPLVVMEGNDTPTLIGSTSFGTNMGCEVGFPAVFTRITSYLEWIRDHVKV